ncbi:MAG TPA: polysaccharide deacetylase family protein, partial [Burkholderiaceae bacterium]|nr:polysaccharide deacetylase family protein [Burkholderiaceae bacterium]
MPSAAQSGAITNALTIDVEDYFQVSAFAPYIKRSDWERTPCRIERNIDRILELLDQHQAKATFFTLGWLAQRYPSVVRDISAHGHEIASHGQAHLRASDQSPAEFDSDIRDAKHVLEDTAG